MKWNNSHSYIRKHFKLFIPSVLTWNLCSDLASALQDYCFLLKRESLTRRKWSGLRLRLVMACLLQTTLSNLLCLMAVIIRAATPIEDTGLVGCPGYLFAPSFSASCCHHCLPGKQEASTGDWLVKEVGSGELSEGGCWVGGWWLKEILHPSSCCCHPDRFLEDRFIGG